MTPFTKLDLTTPPQSGDAVKTAQKHLRDNRFQNFHPGRPDGEYGDHTAAAVRRAKYWLGFAKKSFHGEKRFTYGKRLHQVLAGERKLTPLQRRRRARRTALLDKQLATLKALQLAHTQVGTKEDPPGSNLTKYGKAYGMNGVPWCAIFVSWCITQSQSWTVFRPVRFHYAFVPFVVSDAKAGRNGLSVVSRTGVKRGDLVCFDWEGDGTADHIGFFDGWINELAGTFKTVEGNTAVGNDSNGGEVMARERTVGLVQVFVRVNRVGDAL